MKQAETVAVAIVCDAGPRECSFCGATIPAFERFALAKGRDERLHVLCGGCCDTSTKAAAVPAQLIAGGCSATR